MLDTMEDMKWMNEANLIMLSIIIIWLYLNTDFKYIGLIYTALYLIIFLIIF